MSNNDNNSDEENVFYFESDHLALRGNRDYTNLLRVIAVLEAQKVRVLQQIEELALAKKYYVENPGEFLRKLQNGEEIINVPDVVVPQLPEIGHYENLPLKDIKPIKKELNNQDENETETAMGRNGTDNKSYNQLWTAEEQKRLEELLVKYPEERIEMHRFAKIAKELGNRTTLQVASRVQKYFQKLYSAGLPVPGRLPKRRRFPPLKFKNYYRPSTFFPAYNVPVNIPEDDFHDLYNPVSNDSSTTSQEKTQCFDGADDCEDEGNDIKPSTQDIQEQTLSMLKRIRQEKQNTPEGYNPDPLAAKCVSCQISAVSCANWRCNTCYCRLNVCADCLIQQLMQQDFDHFTHDVVAEN